MFLGDVGSDLPGASIAGMAVASFVAGVPLLASISPLWIYLCDTGFTLAARVSRGEKWYEAHRSHVYSVCLFWVGRISRSLCSLPE